MDRDTLARMIERYLSKHRDDDIHDISQGLAARIDKALLTEALDAKNKLMHDILGG